MSALLIAVGDTLPLGVGASGYWSNAQAIRALNAALDGIGRGHPLRSEAWTETGDGATTEWPWRAGTVYDVYAVTLGEHLLIKEIPEWRAIRDYGEWGWYRKPGAFGYMPALGASDTATFHVRVSPGRILETTIPGGGSLAITFTQGSRDLAVTTGTLSGVSPGDALTGPDGLIYRLQSSTSSTAKLTEAYRGATASASTSFVFGDDPGISDHWRDAVVHSAAARLMQQRGPEEAAPFYALADRYTQEAAAAARLPSTSMFSRSRGFRR